MTDKEIQQRCKDEWDMQVEIFRSCYAKGYNDAKREIAMSGEYERAFERGKKRALEELRIDFEKQIKFYAFSEERWVAQKNDGIKIALGLLDRRLEEGDAE